MPYQYDLDDEDEDYSDPYTEAEWARDLVRRRREALRISNYEWDTDDVL